MFTEFFWITPSCHILHKQRTKNKTRTNIVPVSSNFKTTTEATIMKRSKATLFHPEEKNRLTDAQKEKLQKATEAENKWWDGFERRVKEMKKDGTTPKSGFSFMPFGD